MKKIPTLFKREFVNHNVVAILPEVTPGCEAVLEGKTIPTVKYDGACCAIINGSLYKRYDAKQGKTPPDGAIPCCDPDPVTGHWPHWVKCDGTNPADIWFFEAALHEQHTIKGVLSSRGKQLLGVPTLRDGTYEAIGLHFQGNPYGLKEDILVRHGENVIAENFEPTFEGIKEYLRNNNIEGIVFWKDCKPLCKIKRRDFGFEWPVLNKDDGAWRAIVNGELYEKYDVKQGENPPEEAIPRCDPDPITGHWSYWLKCNTKEVNEWFFEWAFHELFIQKVKKSLSPTNASEYNLERKTIGPYFPKYLKSPTIEGMIFWKDGQIKYFKYEC